MFSLDLLRRKMRFHLPWQAFAMLAFFPLMLISSLLASPAPVQSLKKSLVYLPYMLAFMALVHYLSSAEKLREARQAFCTFGAAEGLFALLALQRGAKVVAIEPNPIFMASMQRTFQRHAPGRITICPIAANDREGWASLSPEPLLSTVGAAGVDGGDNVRLLPLDRLLSDLANVTFIKADVEGHEMRMLKGASGLIRRFHPKLAITCYHEENDPSEMVRFVRGLVPEYRYALTGITQFHGKPLMARFWVPGMAGTAGER